MIRESCHAEGDGGCQPARVCLTLCLRRPLQEREVKSFKV